MSQQYKKPTFKRFVDRKDKRDIIKQSEGFSKRGHHYIPSWIINSFFVSQIGLLTIMFYYSFSMLETIPGDSDIASVLKFTLAIMIILVVSSVFLVNKLKDAIYATEFMSLALSRSIEATSKMFAIVNQNKKAVYYNGPFGEEFMPGKDAEEDTLENILDHVGIKKTDKKKILDAIDENAEAKIQLELNDDGKKIYKVLKIAPLSRPKGLFILKTVNE
jgi:hypothetical protein